MNVYTTHAEALDACFALELAGHEATITAVEHGFSVTWTN
jgi:hypothetical protein